MSHLEYPLQASAGSAAIACAELGHNCIIAEMDEEKLSMI